VFTTDRREWFRLDGKDLLASCEHPTDLELAAARIKRFVEESTDILDLERFTFMGVRSYWMAPTDDFDALRDTLIDRFGGGTSTIAAVAGSRPSDVAWVYEFHDGQPQITVRVGPMKAEQAMTQFFRAEDATLYPPESLWLDVDRVIIDEDQSADQIMLRLTRAIEHNITVAGKLGRYFTTVEPT
jgi:hypothetical protein